MSDHVHFWTRHPEAHEPWSPDDAPGLHLTAYGHAFLELFQRLRAAGRPVSIGESIPARATSVVASMEELVAHQPQIPARMRLRLAAALARRALAPRLPGVVVLRVDTYLSVDAPSFTTLEAMPTRASIRLPRQRVLPLLPQRGIVPRDPARGDRLETVAIKAYSYNVPSWADDGFRSALAELGFTLRIDTELDGRWEDFAEVDVVLCTHGAGVDPRSKPPTKLIAAWHGGAIPVCGRYTGYIEAGIDDENMVLASGGDAVALIGALRRLRDDPAVAPRIRAALPAAVDAHSIGAVLDANWGALTSAPALSRTKLLGSLAIAAPAAAISRVRRLLSGRRG
ncbi:hypothetical protein FVO59_09465 [Microbacterium esteraromaticum]|uniref:Glycosyltransferase family 1 protein n=1 Tax=Microbacterium esteraromaticum TaxID=57043 RepID=A0A7D7WAY6_9MICO|nr:hypothetical protein [Microbacterium esteraromaticum]QMU97418.1 hypothetical protein FVO59_09465 [Microbacterium esteraromaticum]